MFMLECVHLYMELSYYLVWAQILKVANEKQKQLFTSLTLIGYDIFLVTIIE